MDEGWTKALEDDLKSTYYKTLSAFVLEEYKRYRVFPPKDEIYTAFRLTPLRDVRAVILGQDPYHEYGQAQGLAFSVRDGVQKPPSLKNIFKEYTSDLGYPEPDSGSLVKWAQNGVLLLNTVLTVREHMANSHANKGWEKFTDSVIRILNEQENPMVFMLWGAKAGAKAAMLDNPHHLVLRCAHPSPLSAYNGFFGCRHFSKCNRFLESHGADVIDWRLD